jgi:uracil-DNA glycosylase
MQVIDIGNCLKCNIAKGRRNFVQGRGDLPADLLFIGEAPGKSEDLMGEPFIGPSGKLLDKMIVDTTQRLRVQRKITYFITNVILCRPYVMDESSEEYGNNRKPENIEILNCYPYVMEICKKVNPSFVVFVGEVAERVFSEEFPNSLRIYHPSFLLRNGGIKSPYYMTDIRLLEKAFYAILGAK